jgi:hypothetical protein
MVRTNPTTGIEGPMGLKITSGSITRFSALTNAVVRPSYVGAAATQLPNAKAKATNYSLYLGGVLSEVPAPVQSITAADEAWAFDTNPVDNKLDAFYLKTGTINLPNITALGVVAENVKITIKELTNHPTLQQLKNLPVGSWLGTITLSGSKVTLPSVPNLSVTPKATGGNAFTATYDIGTGDVLLGLSKVAYTSPQVTVALSDSTLTLRNSAKDLTLSGTVDLSLPGLGLNKLSGNLQSFTIVNSAVETLKASLSSTTPIGALGLSGAISVDHNFKTNKGTLSVTNGTIAGINVSGNLSYTNSGNPAVDSITGKLNFDNSVARKAIDFDAFGLSLVPLSGQIDYAYAPVGSSAPGATLTLSNVNFDVLTGAATTSFSGNMTLKYDANAALSLEQMDLTLLNPPATLTIPEVGQLKLETAADGKPVKFSLQRYTQSDGTLSSPLPALSGKLSYTSPGGSVYVAIGGLAYAPVLDTVPLINAWTILDAEAAVSFG